MYYNCFMWVLKNLLFKRTLFACNNLLIFSKTNDNEFAIRKEARLKSAFFWKQKYMFDLQITGICPTTHFKKIWRIE